MGGMPRIQEPDGRRPGRRAAARRFRTLCFRLQCPGRGLVNLLQGHLCLVGQFLARFEFRRGLDYPSIQFSQLHRDFTIGGLHFAKLACQLATLGQGPSDAKSAGFTQT